DASTGAITTLVNFANTTNPLDDNRGGDPSGDLVSDGAGNFWGTTYIGGQSSAGTVFKVNASTGAITTVVDFTSNTSLTDPQRGGNPVSGLVRDGGYLWGTTYFGGHNSVGTVFKIDLSTETISTVVDFTDNSDLGDPARGRSPVGALYSDGVGNLWGTTYLGGPTGDGTLFVIAASSGTISTVYDFSILTGGSQPVAALVDDGTGHLWGTGAYGGVNGDGSIFVFNKTTSGMSTVLDFSYSTTGSRPGAPLVSDGTYLWGSTPLGGAYGGGTVFKIDLSGTLTKMADLGLPPPLYPQAGLVSDGATHLWGTTAGGGANSAGSVFKVDPSSGAITTVASFANATTGGSSSAALVRDSAGNFWGTTPTGGANGDGTIFEVDASTGMITKMVDFASSTTGSNPAAELVIDGSGDFWGTTKGGGANSCGTVFKFSTSTGISTVVNFANTMTGGNCGAAPCGALVSDGGGYFWGTTSGGGAGTCGTVFKVNASTWAVSTPVSFAGTMPTGGNRGASPTTALVSDGLGNLWGTAQGGGASGYGTVFKVNTTSGSITTLVDFANTAMGNNRGGIPDAGLASDGAGNLWGTTTQGGANGAGTIFEINTITGAFNTFFDFTGSLGNVPGATPYGTLLSTSAGLYGTTSSGGSGTGGQIFFVASGPPFTAPSAGTITSSGAIISGSANPEGIATSVYVEYGTSTSYGSQTGSTSLGNGTSAVPFGITLSGLSSATTYHYRTVFVTGVGNFYNADQTFTTAP
ncbi:MAG TPA: choice-of-anchor tandem repeat GloVer-containing protein, partial [Chthoniobacter sp.]|nr:choice-of-anchor tandem repeat GloVer-containing protein [Chthoniobacter sp.]